MSFLMRGRMLAFVVLTLSIASSVYLPGGKDDGSDRGKTEYSMDRLAVSVGEMTKDRASHAGQAEIFKDDSDISRYLKIFDRKMMIWSCKNAIQNIVHDGRSPPFIVLSCNVIGKFRSISWHHNNREIASYSNGKSKKAIESGRHSLSVAPHMDRRGHNFSNWSNIYLQIKNASRYSDSGLYRITVTDSDETSQQQKIFVDLTKTRHRPDFRRHRLTSPKEEILKS